MSARVPLHMRGRSPAVAAPAPAPPSVPPSAPSAQHYARTPAGDLVPVDVLEFFDWARAECDRLVRENPEQSADATAA